MSKSNLYKLRKAELLQIIYEQKKQMEDLKKENTKLKNKLENKQIDLNEIGSIDEVTLKINKIFEDAKNAASEYLNNVKKFDNSKKLTKENEVDEKKEIEECFELIPVCMGLVKKRTSLLGRIKLLLAIFFNKIKILNLRKKRKRVLNSIKKIGKKEISRLRRKERIENLKNKGEAFFQNIKTKKNYVKKLLNVQKEKFQEIKKNKKKIKFNKNERLKKKFSLKRKINLDDYDLSLENIESELKKQKNKESKINFAKTSTYYIIIIIAITIIIVTRIFNVIQVKGNSMEPSLMSGDLLVVTKIFGYEKQDIIAFYYDNSVLIKRVIATGGDIVFIDDEGNVFVNSEKIEEDYVKEISYGNCNVTFPFQVPDEEVFVLGDNRETSIDSRNKSIGCISEDKILGKIIVDVNHLSFY